MFLFVLLTVLPSTISTCPDYCHCYLWNHFKRADCVGKHLNDVTNEVSSSVQIFHLSYNVISGLEDRIFMKNGQTRLVDLKLDHNHISDVSEKALQGLTDLHTLDLSWNRISYITKNTFIDNKHLGYLSLAGNALIDYDFDIPSLEVLNLTMCHLAHIKRNAFLKLPNLKSLHLTNNLVLHISVELLVDLNNLQYLYVKGNPLICDETTSHLSIWLRENGITFDAICPQQQSKEKMMEKMISLVDQTKPELAEDTEWEIVESNDEECKWLEELYKETITENIRIASEDVRIYVPKEIEWWPISIGGIIGLQIGLIIGLVIGYCCFGRKVKKRRLLGRGRIPWEEMGVPPGTPPPGYSFEDIRLF